MFCGIGKSGVTALKHFTQQLEAVYENTNKDALRAQVCGAAHSVTTSCFQDRYSTFFSSSADA